MSPNDDIRVLLVDDDVALREEVGDFLTWHKLTVAAASDGSEALAMLAADRDITVVLSDIDMPFHDGLTLASKICQAQSPDNATEVVLMTGHGTIENAAAAVRAGAFDFLRKPMILTDLLPVLRRAHAKATARRLAHAEQAARLARLQADFAAMQVRLAGNGKWLDLSADLPPELRQILSHELRTPLIPLLAMPELLGAPADSTPEAFYALLNDVRRASRRLVDISDDFIELLAPPDGESLTPRPTRADRILARLEAEHRPAAFAARQTLAIVSATSDVVTTDENRLLRSLGRLVANAVTCTRAGGRIELSARYAEPGHIAFAVHDTGVGMTAAEIEVAMRPFWQLDMSRTRKIPGMGLGLPLASRMAERLGGRLEIESVPSVGTTASIVLPVGAAAG
jgi:signal transduction histidine kinase